MKRTIIGIATLLVTSVINFVFVAAQEHDTSPNRTESGLYLMTVVEPGYDVTVKELEKEDQYSVLEVKGVRRP